MIVENVSNDYPDSFAINYKILVVNPKKCFGLLKSLAERRGEERFMPWLNAPEPDRSHVTEKDVEEAITLVQSHVSDFGARLASIIACHLPVNSTVVQLQMYAMGHIDSQLENGTYQMAVALNLLIHFRKAYPACSATYQEPEIVPSEATWLTNHGIKVLDNVTFNDVHFRKAEASFVKSKDEHAFLVVYMIHAPWYLLDAFLKAHWTASQLSRIIIVGNSLTSNRIGADYLALRSIISPRILAFAEFCKETSLEQFWGNPRTLNIRKVNVEDRRCLRSFSNIAVLSISFEDADALVDSYNLLSVVYTGM